MKNNYEEIIKKYCKVRFKSVKEFFCKEKTGVKNNTVRRLDKEDKRFAILKEFSEGKLEVLKLELMCVETEEIIEKTVRDVSIYEDLYIITFGNLVPRREL